LFTVNLVYPPGHPMTFIDYFQTWDAQHYLKLAEQGYDSALQGSMSNAFYPLWPLAIKIMAWLLGGHALLAAFVLSIVFSVGAYTLIFAFVRQKYGEELAVLTVLLMLAYPGSAFLNFAYSEPLFLFLVALFFYCLYAQKTLALACVSFLLPLCRAVGVFCAVPMLLEIHRWPGRWPRYLLVLAVVLGYGSYFLYLYWQTGNPWEGFDAQKRYIAQPSVMKILDLKGFASSLMQPFDIAHPYMNSSVDRAIFLLLLPFIIGTWRLDKAMFAFSVLLGIVPAMTGTFMSYSRFAAVLIPVFIVIAQALSKAGRIGQALVLAVFFMVQVLFLLMHSNSFWVG
jgi:hypothetical protein